MIAQTPFTVAKVAHQCWELNIAGKTIVGTSRGQCLEQLSELMKQEPIEPSETLESKKLWLVQAILPKTPDQALSFLTDVYLLTQDRAFGSYTEILRGIIIDKPHLIWRSHGKESGPKTKTRKPRKKAVPKPDRADS